MSAIISERGEEIRMVWYQYQLPPFYYVFPVVSSEGASLDRLVKHAHFHGLIKTIFILKMHKY